MTEATGGAAGSTAPRDGGPTAVLPATRREARAAAGSGSGGRPGSTRPAGRRPRRRISVIGILGELFITAGVVVLLFIVWQQWFNDLVVGQQLQQEGIAQSQEWNAGVPEVAPAVEPSPDPPPVAAGAGDTERFAWLIVPRFGDDYFRPIAEGVGTESVLNRNNLGHYPDTTLPGETGNFAIAAHRKAYGGNLEHIGELRVGDRIYVETADGWYRYSFRNLEYVQPSGVGVLNAVPQTQLAPDAQYITLTSCNPFFSTAERIIAYGVFDGWFPRDGGAPDEIADTVRVG